MNGICGKIIVCMNTSSEIKDQKPKIIQAILAGFNTIANKPYLMLFPVILDLFLWFGPGWRVDAFFTPLIQSLSGLSGLDIPEYTEMIESYQAIWLDAVANIDLAAALRTLPIGVPSLMVSKQPFINPLGQPPVFSLENGIQILGFWAIFLLVGFFIGNIYFKNISNQIVTIDNETGLRSILRSYLQIILLPVLLLLILLILSVPLLFIITLVTMISPALGQFTLLFAGVIVIWVIMPLIFTPHGIFLYKQNLIAAMMTSIHVVRISMVQTAWFVIVSFLLIEGMDYLWRTPPADNWFLAVGILGRAFIVSAVIASSFHYFIDATAFTQSVMNNDAKPA